MSIREDNKKVQDNLDYKKDKEESQKNNGMQVADVSDKMTVSEINEYLRRAKAGEDVVGYLDKFDLKKIELDQLTALMNKRT